MSLCHQCGLPADGELCAHHHVHIYGDRWAEHNKIYCDFFHRGTPITRLTEAELKDDFPTEYSSDG